jgi:ABC-type glycerol-3-phosphate transport system substrate-binding protein
MNHPKQDIQRKIVDKRPGGLSRRDFLKMTSLAAAATGATLLGAGCSPAAPTSTAAPVQPTGQPAIASKSFAGTLDVWDWEFPVREAIVKEYNAAWEKSHPDIKINYLVLPWADIETKILAVATTGNPPPISDVFGFWRYDLQRAGSILPFPKDFADWDDRLSTPFAKDEDGNIRTFPSGWFVDMIYYNKEIFEKEGLKATDIPRKWEDFIKLSQQLTQTDKDGKVARAGCAMNDYWQHEYLWQDLIYQQAGWMYNEDGTKALWEDEPSVVALQFIQDWYHKYKIDSRELPEGYGGFCNDMAAMFIGSGWNIGFFMNDFPQMEGKWDTVILPTFNGESTPAIGMATMEENFQAFANFPEETTAASYEWIKGLMSGDAQYLAWTKAQSTVPDSKKMLSNPSILEIPGVKAQADSMPYRVCFGERPIEAEKLWRTMFDQVILEQKDVRPSLKEANDGINQILSSKKRYITERNYQPAA